MANLKKSMVFIDGGNLHISWRRFCKNKNISRKINYKKLLEKISEGTDFIRGYYYDAIKPPLSRKNQRFFDMLRFNEITVVLKRLRFKFVKCQHCKKYDPKVPYQKGVDVALVTDLMSLAFEQAYDIAIIVSGDDGFLDAVNFIKSKGKKVWIVSFKESLGQDIMRVADRIIRLNRIFFEVSL